MLGDGPGAQAGRWVVSQTLIDPSGAVVKGLRIRADDPCTAAALQDLAVLETAIFVALPLLPIGVGYWWLRRCLT